MLSPEEITNEAYKSCFNQDRETRTDNAYLNSFLDIQGEKRQEFSSRSDGNRKRQKSPTSHHVTLYSPLAMRRFFLWESLNPLRKTKSTAFPVASKPGKESRKMSSSTPDLIMGKQKELNPDLKQRNHINFNPKNRFSQEMCYYNMELARIILNCIILASGLLYFTSATMMAFYRETLLFFLNFNVYVLSIFSLFATGIILLIIAIGGLCFLKSTEKTLVYAVFAVLVASILISLAIIQKSYEYAIYQYAESEMLSTIQAKNFFQFTEIWDLLHRTFKCCGARGCLDWCTKENFDPKKNLAIGEELFGSLICRLPSSCCLEHQEDINYRYDHCLQFPTPWDSHPIGCIIPIRGEINFLGKMYRIFNIGSTIILLLSATISVANYTQF